MTPGSLSRAEQSGRHACRAPLPAARPRGRFSPAYVFRHVTADGGRAAYRAYVFRRVTADGGRAASRAYVFRRVAGEGGPSVSPAYVFRHVAGDGG
ncbi:MAG: hypothetical protein H0U51_03590 [Propionibacteriales bacterium]|nr:hypothetical protein [Propionibacteriales bacterium]